MVRKFKKHATKVMAIVAVVCMVFTLMPTAALFVTAENDGFYVQAVNVDNGQPIAGATVKIVPMGGVEIGALPTFITSGGGKAYIVEIDNYFAEEKPEFNVQLTVEADGYKKNYVEKTLFSAEPFTVELAPVDETAPTVDNITISNIADGQAQWTNENVTVTIQASDIGRGVDACIRIRGG